MPSPKPHIILIDGKSGVGKTHIAACIAKDLGATLVHLDDSYHGWGGLAAGRDAVVETVLAPLALGVAGHYRTWDWEYDVPCNLVEVPPAAVVVVEGCGVSTPQSRELASTVLWVECDEAVRIERLFGRDSTAFSDYYVAWDEQVDEHIARNDPITTATVVVQT